MLTVIKIGGSVLRDAASFARVAHTLAARLTASPDERLVVIVSAPYGLTDALLEDARRVIAIPDPAALDLLWSTGEVRSVALLALHLQTSGVAAVPFNVHQTGLVSAGSGGPGSAAVRPLRLLAALGQTRVVIVPGFLAVGGGGAIASLGRGGSDLTAVLLAVALSAGRCELVKDVAGYFTDDPHRNADARPIRELGIEGALAMADSGCDLVQRHALEAALRARLVLVVRSLDPAAGATIVQPTNRSEIAEAEGDNETEEDNEIATRRKTGR
ncbi:MAG TPA: hypothetical protein VFX12_07135 [Vicinamibacterales bacterium]|nr:hypothetical protein [Vicinamibacterales bacterium]